MHEYFGTWYRASRSMKHLLNSQDFARFCWNCSTVYFKDTEKVDHSSKKVDQIPRRKLRKAFFSQRKKVIPPAVSTTAGLSGSVLITWWSIDTTNNPFFSIVWVIHTTCRCCFALYAIMLIYRDTISTLKGPRKVHTMRLTLHLENKPRNTSESTRLQISGVVSCNQNFLTPRGAWHMVDK